MPGRLLSLVAVVSVALLVPAPALASGPWTADAVPMPQTLDGRLDAVSCADPSTCVAVGSTADADGRLSTLVETPDGPAWTPVASPDPGGALDAALRGVSCVSSSFCVAVGESGDHGVHTSLIETGRDGVWRLSPHPTARFGERLRGVSCASRTFCVAVGDVDTIHGRRVLINQWDGRTWSVISSPLTGNDYSTLYDVSCPTTTFCQAVGATGADDSDTGNPSVDLIDTWSDGAWTQQQQLPVDGADSATLHGVSCRSATSCLAVGHTGSAPAERAQALTFDGSAWHVTAAPAIAQLDDISCASETFCALTGAGAAGAGWVGRYDGATFTADEPPAATELVGVSCAAAGACVAVGSSGRPVVAAYTDGWRVVRSFAAVGGAGGELDALDCLDGSFCMALGNRVAPDGSRPALAERWDGASWSTVPIVNPPQFDGGAVDIHAVSCVSAAFCVATGGVSGQAAPLPVLEMWDGAGWTPRIAPAPGQSLFGVSCAGPAFCLALGAHGLVVRWDGQTWKRTTPLAGDPDTLAAEAIDCLAEDSCTAVGSAGGAALFERFDGATWTSQPTVTDFPTVLHDVQCVTADYCVAAGNGDDGTGFLTTWNGTHWRAVVQRYARASR